jgi:hypothetical protein
MGRDPVQTEEPLLVFLEQRFADADFRLRDLVQAIALSDGFLRTSGPRALEATGDES